MVKLVETYRVSKFKDKQIIHPVWTSLENTSYFIHLQLIFISTRLNNQELVHYNFKVASKEWMFLSLSLFQASIFCVGGVDETDSISNFNPKESIVSTNSNPICTKTAQLISNIDFFQRPFKYLYLVCSHLWLPKYNNYVIIYLQKKR